MPTTLTDAMSIGANAASPTTTSHLVIGLTFAAGDGGEVEHVADGVPAVPVAGLDVEVVDGGRSQATQRDGLMVLNLVHRLSARGRHDHLLPR